MLHYYAKLFFRKNLISPYYLDDNTLDVYIVNDEIAVKEVRDPVSGQLSLRPMIQISDYTNSEIPSKDTSKYLQGAIKASTGYLRVDIYQYSSLSALFSWNVSYSLTTTSASVFRKSIDDLLSESGCPAKEKCILYLSSTDSSGVPVSSTWFALTYPKYSTLPPAQVQISGVVKLDQNTFEISLSSNVVALYVWLSTDIKGRFSDNGFPIFAANTKVLFFPASDVTAAELTSQLRVRSLTDVNNNNSTNTVIG